MSNTVPKSWSITPIGDVCNIAIGGTPSRSIPNYWDSTKTIGSPWVSIRDLNKPWIHETSEWITESGIKHSNVKLVRKGTVLMSFKLSVGRVAFAGRDLYTNEAIAAFLPKKKNVYSDQFLYQGLQHWNLLENIDQAVKGVTLNKDKINQIETLLPPLPEQQKIAAILSSVDDVIEKARAQIGKLKDLKTGMMQELLTKGIGHTEFKTLPNWRVGRIAVLKSVPANWELVDILSVAKLESGHTPSRDKEMYWGGEIQWLSLHDTKNLINPIIKTTVYSVTQKGIDNSSARILPKGTVALSRTASVGNCVMLGQDMATSQDFANYICGETLHPRYLLQLFRWMQHVWSNLSEGSTHKTIYMPVFKKLQILLPPYAEQLRIADAAEKVDAAIAAKGEKLAVVMNLKKALMQDLLTGKVRVTVDQKESAVA